jgi:hypothetical protein
MEKIGYYDKITSTYVDGELGNDESINDKLFLLLRKEKLWPIYNNLKNYCEDDLFDIMEFCYDNISKPLMELANSYGTTKQYYLVKGYDAADAHKEFRNELNKHLRDYGDGYSIDNNGFIVRTPDIGLEAIFEAEIISEDEKTKRLIKHAVQKFRNRNSTLEDRRDAVRSLADILEPLRPLAKKKMSHQDETDLYNIANGYYIRHNNPSQKSNYDDAVWLNWIFYLYLSTIHALTRIANRQATE